MVLPRAFAAPHVGYTVLVLAVAGVVSVLVSIILLARTVTMSTVSRIAHLVILVMGPAFAVASIPVHINQYTVRIGEERQILRSLRRVRLAVFEYVELNGKLPTSESWCDEIVDLVERDALRLYRRDAIPCIFGMNEALSGRAPHLYPGETVLFVEATGPWNHSGGPELLSAKAARPAIGCAERVYVLFLDGTIGRYALDSAKIAIYTGDHTTFNLDTFTGAIGAFGPYMSKAETAYSPLQWDSGGEW
jgi:hypothetical protein